MTGCTLIQLIAKCKCIPNGLLDTPLDRLRGCVRKEYLQTNPFPPIGSNSSDEDMAKWVAMMNVVNQVRVHPLKINNEKSI